MKNAIKFYKENWGTVLLVLVAEALQILLFNQTFLRFIFDSTSMIVFIYVFLRYIAKDNHLI